MGVFGAITSCVGSVAVVGPEFWANTYDPDTFEVLGVKTGVGDLTEARAYEIEVLDYQGLYVTVPGGQPAWKGARWDGGVAYADNGSGALLDPLPTLAYAPQATNYFLNSEAPVTQTISGRSGVHTVWLEGAGSVAVSGGLTGTVTDGTPLTGDPAGADLILTVTGTPDFVQVEDNDAPTLPIETAGTAVIRDACAPSYDAANHDDTAGTYLIDVTLSGDSNILDGFLSVENGLATLTDGVNTTVAPKTNPEKIGLVYGTEGMRVTADGVQSALVPYDGTLLSDALDLFRASTVVQESGEISRYASANQSLVDDVMPAPPVYSGIVLAVKTTAANETFTLPCFDTGVYDATIDWGDGSATSAITAWDDPALTHTYAEPGVRNVTITGDLPQIYFNDAGDKDKVVGLLSADSVTDSYAFSFVGCALSVVQEIHNATVTTFASGFRACSLVSIPAGMFSNTPEVNTFTYCFDATDLAVIPGGLFDDNPGATSFERTFSLTDITAIPAGLFDYNPLATTFASTFYYTNVAAIPPRLFANNPEAISFRNCFYICNLTAVPAGLFDNNTKVSTFEGCFRDNNITAIPAGLFDNNPDVITFAYCFYDDDITSIPAGLFDNTPNVTDFSSCFRVNHLTSIPSGLFDNTPGVTNYSSCFRSNNLTTIPAGLFDNTPGVTNFSLCFFINNLTTIPSGLFDNTPNVTDFSSCFRSNDIVDVPPGLFDNCVEATDYSLCFADCNLTQQSTDNVLISIDTAGATNGTLDIGGAQPSATGQAAKTSLEGKGWTVTVTTP